MSKNILKSAPLLHCIPTSNTWKCGQSCTCTTKIIGINCTVYMYMYGGFPTKHAKCAKQHAS